jgi:hypothetical protein
MITATEQPRMLTCRDRHIAVDSSRLLVVARTVARACSARSLMRIPRLLAPRADHQIVG